MTGSGSDTAPPGSGRRARARKTFSMCLLAAGLAAGCDEPGYHANWLDYFEPVDTLHIADSVLVRLLVQRDSARYGVWRVTDLGSQAWLRSPSHGERVADAMMGLPPDVSYVPYWPSWASILGAQAGLTVFAATNLTYVVRVYGADGSRGDSIVAHPPSWKQARRPARGEFAYATDGELRAYFSSFNVITGLAAVSEDVLVVTHGRRVDVSDDPALDQIVGGRAVSEYVNVYARGLRLVTDAPAPGEILGYGTGRLVFGKRVAGRTGYILTEYVWQPQI